MSSPLPGRVVQSRFRAAVGSVEVWTTPRAAAAAVLLLACALSTFRLSLPHVLTGAGGYDDGVYMAAAERLIHGHLPYRDFVFLHPPGLPLLLSPVALAGDLLGSRDAFGMARVLTALVGSLDAALVGYALRARGRATVVFAGCAFAVFPLTVSGSGTLTLEPYLLLFALLATCLLFPVGGIKPGNRTLWAGVCLGLAMAIKLTGGVPALAAVIIVALYCRPALLRLLIGMATGVTVPCLPFIVAAPAAFVHDVVLVQVQRGQEARYALPTDERVLDLFGLRAFPQAQPSWGKVSLVLLICLVSLCLILDRKRLLPVESFSIAAALLVVAAMLKSPQFYTYYAYFPAAFLSLTFGWVFASLRAGLASRLPSGWRLFAVRAVGLVAVLALLSLVPVSWRYSRGYLAQDFDPAPAVQRAGVAASACVLFDSPALAIASDRLAGPSPGCPPLVDPFGTWLAVDPKRPPPLAAPAAFTRMWKNWMSAADAVLLSARQSSFIPWTPDLVAWFDARYVVVDNASRPLVYRRVEAAPVSSAQLLLRGLAEQEAGHLFLAEDDYHQLERLDPGSPVASFDLGVLAGSRGELGEARVAYERSLRVDPHYAPALYNLAVLVTSTDPLHATRLYRDVLAMNPLDPSANLNLGLLLYGRGDKNSGRQLLETAVRLRPDLRSRLPVELRTPLR